MRSFETEAIEYKSEVNDKVIKGVLAFANTTGGTLYIGVDDSGKVVGLADIDEECTKLTNKLRDSISPDVTMFISLTILSENDLNYIKLEVSTGSSKPYYLRSTGLRSEGVYVRQGASSVPASMEQIREMIKQTDGVHYEALRSLNQDLTFIYASEIFNTVGIAFGEPQFLTLGIKSADGLFTNLGLLLSDQCPHLVKAASFSGTTRVNFKYRKELTGSVLKQAEDAFQFATMGLPTFTTIKGMYRTDTFAIAPEAIRESIYNALVHREYSIDGPTILSVFDDRVEVLSLGGLVISEGLSGLIPGVSVCRNKALADVIYRLHLIEAYGTGLPRIADAYADSSVKYSIEATQGCFRITLPYKPEVLKAIAKRDAAEKTSFFNET